MEPSIQRRGWRSRLIRRRSRRTLHAERRPLTHGASFAAMGFVASAGLSIVSSVVTARLYGIEIIGQLALAMAPMAMLRLLSTVREQPGLVRRIAPLPPRDERVTGIWLAVFAFSVGLTILVAAPLAVVTWLLFAGPIGQPELFAPSMVYLAAYIAIANSSWNVDSIFAAYGDGRQLFVVRLHETLVTLSLVAALSFHPSVWSPVIAAVVGWTTALAHRVVAVRAWLAMRASRAAIRDGFAELGAIVRFGLKMTPGSIAAGTATQAGTWTLGIVAPVAVVGAYNRAWSISARFVEVNWRLGEMVFPALVERHARRDRAGFERIYTESVRYTTTCLVGLAAVGGGAAEAIMALFGPGFETASTALALTLIVPWTTTIATLQWSALLALGLPGATSVTAIVSAAVTLIATVALAEPLGVTGPALALVIGSLIGIVLSHMITRRHVRPAYRDLWPYRQRILTVLAYVAGFVAGRLADAPESALALPLALLASSLAYALVFVGGGGLSREDRERLRQLRDWLRRRRAVHPAEAPSATGGA
jgi:O-antigen/teichoic acid export membrane protein